METEKVEEKIYSALKSDSELISKIAGIESIYHLQAPAHELTKYPCIVYSPISDVPFFHADNHILAHKLSIRIHIITLDGEYAEIAEDIHRIMTGLKAKRYQSIPYAENKEKILIVDYRMLVNKEEPESIEDTIAADTDTKECDCKHHCSDVTINGSIISDEEIDEIIKNLGDETKK